MFSLVADYGTSDEDKDSSTGCTSDEESDCGKPEAVDAAQSSATPALPSARLMLANEKKSIPGGVFSNPFKEAEDAKMASLEKHVKMVDPEHEISEQKRKICWSYRKGRCRFGSKCNFAHDSDLILKKEQHGAEQEEPTSADQKDVQNETAPMVRKQTLKKKRPGLSRELVPPKKVLKMYQRDKFYSGKP
ncbi:AAEL015059-PB [Aedes aegypti]|uniref:AAEL015059-PA n=1 Tax=Aedes aegypti TaxID=7159 RepID=Q16EQ8_AEDAE|nr:AAEL015059-PA [Aedes aegypti]EAT32716.1 AAEL015059-PB [Aedes aegypti]